MLGLLDWHWPCQAPQINCWSTGSQIWQTGASEPTGKLDSGFIPAVGLWFHCRNPSRPVPWTSGCSISFAFIWLTWEYQNTSPVWYHFFPQSPFQRFVRRGRATKRKPDLDDSDDSNFEEIDSDLENNEELSEWLGSVHLKTKGLLPGETHVRKFLPPGTVMDLYEHYSAAQTLQGGNCVSYLGTPFQSMIPNIFGHFCPMQNPTMRWIESTFCPVQST